MSWPDLTKFYWDEWLLLAVQVATLVFLMLYVWKTWQMASATRTAAEAAAAATYEAKEGRIEALAPRMMIYFAPEPTTRAEVVLENIGMGTATNVQVVFRPPLKASQGSLDANKFFETAKPLFPRRYRVVHGFDVWPSYFAAKLPRRFEVTITYQGKETGRTYDDVHVLDVGAMEHRVAFSTKGMPEMIRELEKLSSATEKGWRDLGEKISIASAAGTYETASERPLDAILHDIESTRDAWQKIEADQLARTDWESFARFLRSAALDAYRSYRRNPEGNDERTLVELLQLTHRPPFWIDDEWRAKLGDTIGRLAVYRPTSSNTR